MVANEDVIDAICRAEEIAARMKKLGAKSFTYKDDTVAVSAEFGPDYLAYGQAVTPTVPPAGESEDY